VDASRFVQYFTLLLLLEEDSVRQRYRAAGRETWQEFTYILLYKQMKQVLRKHGGCRFRLQIEQRRYRSSNVVA